MICYELNSKLSYLHSESGPQEDTDLHLATLYAGYYTPPQSLHPEDSSSQPTWPSGEGQVSGPASRAGRGIIHLRAERVTNLDDWRLKLHHRCSIFNLAGGLTRMVNESEFNAAIFWRWVVGGVGVFQGLSHIPVGVAGYQREEKR
ncbi:hypothetical protein Pcinc_027267 [Petrolisthes cinctipes]|uniref:Uncharacterized protein n=1 Tax=Petrolisthes cinctipes TaxID=88211 RepID=A0AAE1KAI6_PETCI|nr:hypothetical protein Pcinc_027267 [Petrolisthes cinctipes]